MAFESTYNTINLIYNEINKRGLHVYMVGGISAAIQAGVDLYRQNDDIDFMVEDKDLPALIEILQSVDYSVEDKRGNNTGNRVDSDGKFHPMDHELNADTVIPGRLGVGIFVFERRDGQVITNSYAFEENENAVVDNQKVMPEELFNLMYSSEDINYKGTDVRCQSKEYIYMTKSRGTREKDKQDAEVVGQYIGEEEQARIARIKKLENRTETYRVVYGRDGEVVSRTKMPSNEDKIASFIRKYQQHHSDLTPDELKQAVLGEPLVMRLTSQDAGIRKIMIRWSESRADGDVAESARMIAHDHYFSDEPENNSHQKDEIEQNKDIDD